MKCPLLLSLFFISFTADAQTNPDIELTLLDQKNNAVVDAVAYLRTVDGSTKTRPGQHQIQQKNKQFTPFVKAVTVNSEITFPNLDDVKHHVYSFSEPKTFEIQLYRGTNPNPIVLDQPGVIVLGCNIHDWMVGYIVVLDTPYFGITNSQGKIQFPKLPPGEYQLLTWHPGMGKQQETLLDTLSITEHAPASKLNYSLKLKPMSFWKPDENDTDNYSF